MSGQRMKHLLVVTYLFPPLAGAGVHRWAKMTKYLADFGWRTTVVTAANDRRVHRDTTLAAEVPPHVRVLRVPDYGLKYAAAAGRRVLGLPLAEGHAGWVPFATRRVLAELAGGDYDALCTTLGPFTLMQTGLAARRRHRVPWVMDLRDPSWSYQAGGIGSQARGPREAARRRALEVDAYGHADAVVTVDEAVRDALVRAPEVRTPAVHVVPNGYDEDDFAGASCARRCQQELRLTFVGRLARSDRYQGVLRALAVVAREGETATHLRVCIAGEIDPAVARDFRDALPPQCVRVEGYLPVRKACRRLTESDLLLFVLPAYTDGAALRAHSKTYNYLRAGRPILAPIPDGAAARLLARSGAATIVSPDDTAAIARALRGALDAWAHGTLAAATDWNVVRQFERRRLAGRFAQVLDDLLAGREGADLPRAAASGVPA
jgi:glycosyltransferase involved in cell wall biosynthesis